MGTFLFSITPHDWTLTVVAISVVFLCLLLLYGVYSALGAFWSGKLRRRVSRNPQTDPDEETAAAIMIALKLYNADLIHDRESGIITIKSTPGCPKWEDSREKLSRK